MTMHLEGYLEMKQKAEAKLKAKDINKTKIYKKFKI